MKVVQVGRQFGCQMQAFNRFDTAANHRRFKVIRDYNERSDALNRRTTSTMASNPTENRRHSGHDIAHPQPNALLSIFDSDKRLADEDLLQTARVAPVEISNVEIHGATIPKIVGELWTAGQRQASSIHEVSYRACFKPQLPHYFIKRFTKPGDWVYDPFSGRGTTAIEAALMGRRVVANDINPLSAILTSPRLVPPQLHEIADRLSCVPKRAGRHADIDLSMFFHRETESEIVGLREYLIARRDAGKEDAIDAWIRMVATNRLTGHSPGFFSVYSFPPNQAVSAEAQKRINVARRQVPPYRDTVALILRKSKQLLSGLSVRDVEALRSTSRDAVFLNCDAGDTPVISKQSIQLTVTSPPFLDIVQYADDNWLRCWFNDLDLKDIEARITMARTVERWSTTMGSIFRELFRVTKLGGVVAFEVGEVRGGKVHLDEHVVPLGLAAGFDCLAILINSQSFTKTANIWGVSNNRSGTNTNRIVVFRRT